MGTTIDRQLVEKLASAGKELSKIPDRADPGNPLLMKQLSGTAPA